ncbi:DNA-directed RNA polymerase II subunit J [Cladochytrium replicatum]|nr:DNA-directed RNA polymerase II subunit J [Cladochytrium replicatum]
MNAPDRFELFVIPDGQQKVEMVKDPKIPNAATFTILKEDHTLGNVLRAQLLKNPKVLFAGYKMPHPLEHKIEIKVQTTPDTNPLAVIQQELNNLISEVQNIKLKFENEVNMQPHQMEGVERGGRGDFDF